MQWVLVGMICNSLHCYWVRDTRLLYEAVQDCIVEKQKIKDHSAMYFDVGCTAIAEIEPIGDCELCIATPERR